MVDPGVDVVLKGVDCDCVRVNEGRPFWVGERVEVGPLLEAPAVPVGRDSRREAPNDDEGLNGFRPAKPVAWLVRGAAPVG